MNAVRSHYPPDEHSEFMHGQYDQGHGAGLEDFGTLHEPHPLFAGGFMWAYSDEAVQTF